jgi:peptidoglycan recognition protein
MQVISRNAWGARRPAGPRGTVAKPASYVLIHHTAGYNPTVDTTAEEEASMRAIQNYHMNSRGYKDIAYSFVVFASGRLYEGRGWGTRGAHTLGDVPPSTSPAPDYNGLGYAWCFAGDFTAQTPTQKAIDAVVAHATWGIDNGWIKAEPHVKGHSEVSQTGCPGTHLKSKVSLIATRIYQGADMPLNDQDFAKIAKLIDARADQERASARAEYEAIQKGLNVIRADIAELKAQGGNP